jgi:hypothetical protein
MYIGVVKLQSIKYEVKVYISTPCSDIGRRYINKMRNSKLPKSYDTHVIDPVGTSGTVTL